MSHHEPSESPSQEVLARRHRRMQLGLGLREEDDRRAERIAARSAFDTLEKEGRWSLVLIGVFVTALMVAFGVHFSGTVTVPEPPAGASTFTVVPTPTPPMARPLATAPTRTLLPTDIARSAGLTQVTRSSMPPPAPIHYEPPQVPAVAPNYPPPPATPAPDYAARDRRIAELKRESDALDDHARNVRTNSGVSHLTGTQFPDYWAWRHQHNGWTNSGSLNQYLKSLDQYRNEVRREKWRLEGR